MFETSAPVIVWVLVDLVAASDLCYIARICCLILFIGEQIVNKENV